MNNKPNIVILDYGVGNLYSIQKALSCFDVNVCISGEISDLDKADKVILPGVGSFQAGMKGLRLRNLIEPLKKYASLGKPILGICLGAQLLLSEGHEFGRHEGLDLIPGKVIAFPELKDYEKIPHIGWNKIYSSQGQSWNNTLLHDVNDSSEFYFVHSYVLQPSDPKFIFSLSKYGGYEFCSTVKKDNIYGCQFHPEKSGEVGLAVVSNFINIV